MNAAPDTLKAILFDLDGTLIDTATDFVIVLDRLCTEYQVETVPYAAVHKTVSSGARALVKLAFDIGETDARFVEIHSRLLSLYLDQVAQSRARTYPGISDLLSALDDSSIQWGIVTNKPEIYTTVLLR